MCSELDIKLQHNEQQFLEYLFSDREVLLFFLFEKYYPQESEKPIKILVLRKPIKSLKHNQRMNHSITSLLLNASIKKGSFQ